MPQLDPSTYLSQIFWLLLTFLSLWFFMSWFIIPRIEDILEQRRRKIDGYIQKAEKINKQALQSLEKYEKALKKAKNKADERIEQNKNDLAKIISEKHTEIEDILNRKIADNEYTLTKQRQETLATVELVSEQLANSILLKFGIQKNAESPSDKE